MSQRKLYSIVFMFVPCINSINSLWNNKSALIQYSIHIAHIIRRGLVDNVTIDNCQEKLVS
jgi:hypothetical protein